MSFAPPILSTDPIILDLYAHINRLSNVPVLSTPDAIQQGSGITEIAGPLYGGTLAGQIAQYKRIIPMLVVASMRVFRLRLIRFLFNDNGISIDWAFALYDNTGNRINYLIGRPGTQIGILEWDQVINIAPGVYYLGFSSRVPLTGNFVRGMVPSNSTTVQFPRTGNWTQLPVPTISLPQQLIFDQGINEAQGPIVTPYVYLTSF